MTTATISRKKSRLMPIAILAAALLLLFLNPTDPRENTPKLAENARRDLVSAEVTNPDITTYRKVQDSLDELSRWKTQRLTRYSSGVEVLFAGVTRIDECVSCFDINERNIQNKYFISLPRFALKEDAGFRLDGNDYILERFEEKEKTELGSIGYKTDEKIDVRLLDPQNDTGVTVLLPVSSSAYHVVEVIMYFFLALALIVVLWLFIKLPATILINIGKGKPFLLQNVRNLYRIGWGLIIVTFLMAALPWLTGLAFSSKLPEEIYFPFWSTLLDSRWAFVGGLAILMTARAFKQGYQLQQEQSLTI
jgi:hypothetical protein